jgi:L-asparaginase
MFGNVLLRGNRSKKMHEFNLHSFISPNCLPLAEMGIELRFGDHCIERHGQKLNLRTQLVTDVAYIKLFPGITNEHILGMIPARTKGVVVEAYGAGNIPLGENGIQEALENIISQDISLVIATQCVYGSVEYQRYQGGYFAKTHGALSAQDMTSETAIIKLMWLLAQTSNFEELWNLYHKNLAGELTER